MKVHFDHAKKVHTAKTVVLFFLLMITGTPEFSEPLEEMRHKQRFTRFQRLLSFVIRPHCSARAAGSAEEALRVFNLLARYHQSVEFIPLLEQSRLINPGRRVGTSHCSFKPGGSTASFLSLLSAYQCKPLLYSAS